MLLKQGTGSQSLSLMLTTTKCATAAGVYRLSSNIHFFTEARPFLRKSAFI